MAVSAFHDNRYHKGSGLSFSHYVSLTRISNIEERYFYEIELHALIAHLKIKEKPNWDWFILLVVKTGMRFLELIKGKPESLLFVEAAREADESMMGYSNL